MFADAGAAALLACRLDSAVFTEGGAATLLAFQLDPAVFADGAAAALLALRLLAAVFADGGAATILARRLVAAVSGDSVLRIRLLVSMITARSCFSDFLAVYNSHSTKWSRRLELRGSRSPFLEYWHGI